MDLSNLKAPAPNKKGSKRVGRGEGSGKGQESGRGMNGAKSRSGYKYRPWFEGGQMPLQRRVPKFGFVNPNRVDFRPVNLRTISEFIEAGKLETKITVADLISAGLADDKDRVKLLGTGDLESKIEIEVHAASKSASEKVEKAGGTVTILK
ncbi:MAG: 50S ribosomal protein L15 [Rhodobacteraceae bacterium]|nr:50S ribosomal protein L15 [Paracoccaceae bacterium]HCD53333.1 50S ribosomal protein L15 [Balneolaceae bacterium]|tara:strand:- start:5725 stop:6177 length:453 start_codon:yes stop_codon:yes gene_type:complete